MQRFGPPIQYPLICRRWWSLRPKPTKSSKNGGALRWNTLVLGRTMSIIFIGSGVRSPQKMGAACMAGRCVMAHGATATSKCVRCAKRERRRGISSTSALLQMSRTDFTTCPTLKKAHLWKLDGPRMIAAAGARTTTFYRPSTSPQPVAAAGFATTRAWDSYGSCARTTRSCGR